jgi:hypothetical protein
VLAGIEAFGLLDRSFRATADTLENVTVGPIVLWYPWNGGVFLKGGVTLGVGSATVHPPDLEPVTTRRLGAGVAFGAGFDIPVHKWLSITANFGVYYNAQGDVLVKPADGVNPAEYLEDVIVSMYNANFAITLR